MDLRFSCTRIHDRSKFWLLENPIYKLKFTKSYVLQHLWPLKLLKTTNNSTLPNMDLQSSCAQVFNWSFRMWIGKYCPISAPWQPFWIFGGHFELFCSLFLCSDIKFKYSWLPTCANKTGSKNYNFKLVFCGALSKNIAIFGPFGGHFDFLAAILDFYWFVRY